ncbi:MAG: hypothetical protein PUE06_00365 [Bacteroidales bacterium]|nr:hypothetical protein [Bacteroidales bacterium]
MVIINSSYLFHPSVFHLVTAHVVLDPDLSHRAHNRSGIFYPVILKDGRVCGNWKLSDMSLSFFDGEEVDDSVAAKAISSYSSFAEVNQIKRRQQ